MMVGLSSPGFLERGCCCRRTLLFKSGSTKAKEAQDCWQASKKRVIIEGLAETASSYLQDDSKSKKAKKVWHSFKISVMIEGFADRSEDKQAVDVCRFVKNLQPISVGVWRLIAKFFGTKSQDFKRSWSKKDVKFRNEVHVNSNLWVARKSEKIKIEL